MRSSPAGPRIFETWRPNRCILYLQSGLNNSPHRGYFRWVAILAPDSSEGGVMVGRMIRLGYWSMVVLLAVAGQAAAAGPDLRLVNAAAQQDWKAVRAL